MIPVALPGTAVEPDRAEARRRARDELADPGYSAAEPSWVERALDWVRSRVEELLDSVSGATPGGALGALVVTLLLVLAAALVLRRTGGYQRSARRAPAVLDARPLDPAEHRRAADLAAAEGRWADAVRERLRATTRDLETRGVLAPQPGRTADELALQAGSAIPEAAGALRAASRAFDEIWYGGRTATPSDDELARVADQAVRTARPAHRVGGR